MDTAKLCGLFAKATRGPWESPVENAVHPTVTAVCWDGERRPLFSTVHGNNPSEAAANADLIAAMYGTVPDLITALAASEARATAAESQVAELDTKARGLADSYDEMTVAFLAERERVAELEIASAQAVEFAEYVEGAAKGAMAERAKHYLSLPYSQEVAARLSQVAELRARCEGLEETLRGAYWRMDASYHSGNRIMFHDLNFVLDSATKHHVLISPNQLLAEPSAQGSSK